MTAIRTGIKNCSLPRVECGDLDIRVDGIDYTLHQGEAILNLSMTKTNTYSLSSG